MLGLQGLAFTSGGAFGAAQPEERESVRLRSSAEVEVGGLEECSPATTELSQPVRVSGILLSVRCRPSFPELLLLVKRRPPLVTVLLSLPCPGF